MDQASQISKSVAGSTLMSQWRGDRGVRKLPAGNIGYYTQYAKPEDHTDKTVQNLVQDAIASNKATTIAETSDVMTKTVVIHTKTSVQSESAGHAESSSHIDKTVENITQGGSVASSVAPRDTTETTTEKTSVQLDDQIISIFFKILLWRIIVEDKNHYFENPQNKNTGSRGGVLSEEANKLREKMQFNPKVKNKVLAEIKEYTRNPHRIDHPVLAAVCANCPKLLKVFIASVDKFNEEAVTYTLDRTGQNDTTTPLIMAVGMRNMKFMQQLLKAGAKPDPVHPPKDKTTALMVAVATQNTRMVERLMAHGAKLDPVGPQGTAIDIARSYGYHDQDIEDIERYLRTRGTKPSAALPSVPVAPEPADAYKVIRKIDVQLMSAVCTKDMKHIEKLMKKGANPNVAFPSYDPEAREFGYTALYCAIQKWTKKEDTVYINKLCELCGNYGINERDQTLLTLAVAATLSLSPAAQFDPEQKTIVRDAKNKLDAWGIEIPSKIKKVLTEATYLEN